MSGALEAVTVALRLASRGLPVFPCGRNKRPVIPRKEGGRGFHDASTDPDRIRSLFSHRGSVLVGCPTGRITGFNVLDFDYRHRAQEWEVVNAARLPRTLTHATMSGGRHRFFCHADGVHNSEGEIALGIDVRGEGGYVIMPPSLGYSVLDDCPIVPWPDWLLDEILSLAARKKNGHAGGNGVSGVTGVLPSALPDAGRYAGLLRAWTDQVARASDGQKHYVLRNAALAIGGVLDRAGMTQNDALAMLLGALPGSVADWDAARATALWGLEEGRSRPIPLREDDGDDWRSSRQFASVPRRVVNDAAMPRNDAAERFTDGAADADAAPLDWPFAGLVGDEMDTIGPRGLVYGHSLWRRYVSVLGGPGGVGKSALTFTVALAVITGRALLGETVHAPGPVALYNLEDDRDELMRRLIAAMLCHGVSREQVVGRLFLTSGRDVPLSVARPGPDGRLLRSPAVDAIIAGLRKRGIVLLIVDPVVRSHQLEENRNEHMDFIAAIWAEIAEKAECAVWLVHHFRKGGVAGEAASFRGASAFVDSSRSAIGLSAMTADEAARLNVRPAERVALVRCDNPKVNMSLRPESAMWLKLVGIDIGNATAERPSDNVQAMVRWSPPSPWAGMDMATVVTILERLAAGVGDGEQFTLTRRGGSERWAGDVVMDIGRRSEAQTVVVLRAWSESQLVVATRYRSPSHRHLRDGMKVDLDKLAEMRGQAEVSLHGESDAFDPSN